MKKYVRYGVPSGILVVGIVFVLVGLEKGQQLGVLQKAINICLECIGIG